ncbi:TauD/TfdA family dioxygenase [Paraglaciecola sp.]|uniref:TauD/TfdA family dioxygenase n=1 Tax=Paraglaciecola sp. TaxID=1920173 RepID=UPI0030F389C6
MSFEHNFRDCIIQLNTTPSDFLEDSEGNTATINKLLDEKGFVLVRGLSGAKNIDQVKSILTTCLGGELIEYNYRSTPRKSLGGNVYTATEYHSDVTIPQHNENAYSNNYPMRLGFYCVVPSKIGGRTPIADSVAIYNKIPKDIRDEFERKEIKYVRNYSNIDLPWQEVFNSDHKEDVEKYCANNNIEFAWLKDGSLRTSQVNPASRLHPKHEVPVWFNQAHLFHVSNLDPELRETLISTVGEEGLPRNTFFGDGSPICEQQLDEIRKIIDAEKISFAWLAGDMLLIDNMRYTHGREPFEGKRQLLVGMSL